MNKHMESIIGHLYDGVLSAAAWNDGLDGMCRQLQAGVYHYFTLDSSGADVPESAGNVESFGLHAGLMREYEIHHADNDLRMAKLFGLQPGQVMVDHEHISSRDALRNPVYVDWLLPLGLSHTMGVMVRVGGTARDIMSFMRASDAKPYSAWDKAFLEQLRPHVSRAATLRAHMRELSRRCSIGLVALETLPQGMAVVDARCQIHYANPAAERLMTPPSAVGSRCGRLHCLNGDLQSRVEEIVGQACGAPGKAGAVDSLMCASQAARLVVTVLPLKASHMLTMVWQKPLALVILTVPGAITALDHRMVSDMLGLSPSEARLLLILAAGKSVKDYAAIEGCSWHTARTHMKNLMRKTGCHRQVEVVQLLQALQVG